MYTQEELEAKNTASFEEYCKQDVQKTFDSLEEETSRKLCTVRKIQEIRDIPGADFIYAYRVDGWWVVDKRGKYEVDSLVLYCEIDSWVPTSLAPFLSKEKEPSEYRGIKGERLRTIRLKGQVSQGLLLPLHLDYKGENYWASNITTDGVETIFVQEGDDLTQFYGILKWERPTNPFNSGPMQSKGNWPHYLHKTDQERIQNIPWNYIKDDLYYVTEKLDGSSMTVYVNGEDSGVCSKNINLKEDLENKWWQVQKKYNLIEKLKSTGKNLAIQGELVGPNTCDNKYKLDELRFYGFNVFDIDKQENYLPLERTALFKELDIPECPLIYFNMNLKGLDKENLLTLANGYSTLNNSVLREGFVYSSLTDPNKSFKTVSDDWLLKYKE